MLCDVIGEFVEWPRKATGSSASFAHNAHSDCQSQAATRSNNTGGEAYNITWIYVSHEAQKWHLSSVRLPFFNVSYKTPLNHTFPLYLSLFPTSSVNSSTLSPQIAPLSMQKMTIHYTMHPKSRRVVEGRVRTDLFDTQNAIANSLCAHSCSLYLTRQDCSTFPMVCSDLVRAFGTSHECTQGELASYS